MPSPSSSHNNSNSMSVADCQRLLRVRDGCDGQALKAAYKAASLRAHPDNGGSAEAFQHVATAYEILTKHQYEERWGTSNGSYGQGAAQGQPKLLTDQPHQQQQQFRR